MLPAQMRKIADDIVKAPDERMQRMLDWCRQLTTLVEATDKNLDEANAVLSHPIVACAVRFVNGMPASLYSGTTYVGDKVWCVRIMSQDVAKNEDDRQTAGQRAREAIASLAVLVGADGDGPPESVAKRAWDRVLAAEADADAKKMSLARAVIAEARKHAGAAVASGLRDALHHYDQHTLADAIRGVDNAS
jgi:hypothetical protein